MRIYTLKAVRKKEKRLESVTCSFCGKNMLLNKEWGYVQGGQIDISFGYGSINDKEYFIGDVCDDCFEKLFRAKLAKVRGE